MKEIEFEQQKKREKQEREAWQQIDELVDTNKTVLARHIEDGMKKKSSLTLI